MPWAVNLRQQLLTSFPLAEGLNPISEMELLEPKWTLSLHRLADIFSLNAIIKSEDGPIMDCSTSTIDDYRMMAPVRASPSDTLSVTLEENQRMTPATHWQDVRHLALSSTITAAYGPGDVLTIYPKNSVEDVDQILSLMDWTDIADKPISFAPTKPTYGSSFYPSPPIALPMTVITLRLLLMEHLDLTAIPRRSFFSLIAHFTDDQFHKDRLLEFTKPEYIDELYDYTTRPRRSILEVLQEFETVKIPWQWAATVLPELRGRQFSIASGGQLKIKSKFSTRFEILAAIVKYKTVIKKVREGVCTRYLANLPTGSRLCVKLQKGGLAIAKSEVHRPVIMIGPGTGVAPMRSLIWERLLWTQWMRPQSERSFSGQSQGLPTDQSESSFEGSSNNLPPFPQSLLFFGCRNESVDYFYREEWDKMKDLLPFEVHAAFSRDQEKKVYVQDLIRSQASTVFRLLHESDGIVYVCGSSGKMPQAVRAALVDVFVSQGKMEHEAAEKYIKGMEGEKRYKQETW